MLYCPARGQELLSALGVSLECHASNVCLVPKPPLSIRDALSKSLGDYWTRRDKQFLNLIRGFNISEVFFFPGVEGSARRTNVTP